MQRIMLTLLLGITAGQIYAADTLKSVELSPHETKASQEQIPLNETTPQLSMSSQLRSRTGTAGLGRLDETSLGIVAALPLRLRTLRISVASVSLNADTPASTAGFGTLPALGPSAAPSQSVQGTALNLDFEPLQNLRIQMGTTPLGYPVQDVTGSLYWRQDFGSQQVKLGAERRAVTDSVLSYAGVHDPHTGQLWGGVRQSRLRLAWSTYLGGWGMYAGGAASWFDGRHVPANQSLEWSVGSYHLPLTLPVATVVLATNVTALGYERNQSGFTLGQGGYFSPKTFRRAGVSATLHGRRGAITYLVLADLGWQQVRQEESPWFPLDANLGEQSQGDTNSRQIGGSGRISMEYALAKRSSLGINGTINRVSTFTESSLQVYLRYWFTPPGDTLHEPPRPPIGADLFADI